jgi:acyl carrier protein
VRDACVVAQPDDSSNSSLCAFVALNDMPGVAEAELKSHLRARLPDYMIPAKMEYVSVLPLNRNGKIDRKALEMRKSAYPFAPMIQHPPQTDAEQRVAQICQAVLGIDSIDIDQNLFDLGANSILAMMIASRLMIAFGVETPRTLVFDLPTVSGLAEFLSPNGEEI